MLRTGARRAIFGAHGKVRHADVIVGLAGQSNNLNMSSVATSPPAANANTIYFSDTRFVWGAVPAADGIRKLLNGINDADGKSVGALNGAVSGVPLDYLLRGSGTLYYDEFISRVRRSGGYLDFLLIHHGEGDVPSGTSSAVYQARLSRLHADICSDLSIAKAQCPIVLSSLATCTSIGTDANWDAQQRTLLDCAANLPSVYYSHSNMDAVLTDGTHWDGTSYGHSGERGARSINTVRGATSGFPKWSIASAATVDATTTTVTLTHGIGTDFTPTSAITGFEVSGDNGSNWVTPSAAVRTNATTITLTHSSLATDSQRKLRYQFGRTAVVSAPVVDNSSLAAPLLMSAATISPTPLAAAPVPTYITSSQTAVDTAAQTVSSINLGASPAAADLMVVLAGLCGNSGSGITLSTITITPSGGSPISGTVVQNNSGSGDPYGWIARVAIPAGTTGINNCVVTVTYNTQPFVTTRVVVWTVPAADLSSQTPVDADMLRVTANTVATLNISTSAGGFWIAVAASDNFTSNSCSWTADEASTRRLNSIIDGGHGSAADGSGTTAQTNADTIEATFTQSGDIRILAASWR